MKNSLFICLENVEWKVWVGPSKDEIVQQSGTKKEGGTEFLIFYEYDRWCYNPRFFREIQPPMDINIEDFIVEKQTV